MATPKTIKKAPKVLIDLPECPVCMETMSAPIYQCQTGHSLCNSCTKNLLPPICPICRQDLTQTRNWQLEEIVAKVKVACPNNSSGCLYTVMSVDLEEHLKECIFREMDCPLGVVFGKCSWTGKLENMLEHFKNRHASHCNVATDEEVELTNVDLKNDDRHFYLVEQSQFLFMLTMKIDSLQNMVYWTIQHIGSKKAAHDHIYEIHLLSKQNPRRKIVFTENCLNDAIKPEEIFRQGNCAALPLEVLVHYIKDKKLSFRFFIKRTSPPPVMNKNNKSDGYNVNPGPGLLGPVPMGPRNNESDGYNVNLGPGLLGPVPMGPRNNESDGYNVNLGPGLLGPVPMGPRNNESDGYNVNLGPGLLGPVPMGPRNNESDGYNVNPGPGLLGPVPKPNKTQAQSQLILRNSQLSHPFTLHHDRNMGCYLDFRSTMKFANYVYPIGIYSCTML